ncbi:MAG TPA: hypothetical protein VLK89_04060, partial [Solirubrobacterales bacterium]|nr:hypothetical protein [Solirubrobacterales bacterium]
MSHVHTPARRPFLVATTAALILALALLLPGLAAAHGKGYGHSHPASHHPAVSHHHYGHHGQGHHGQDKRDLTVMTQNLYLGSSLGPALEAKTPEEFVAAVARIYATVQYTNFPQRAEAIADEIQEKGPDLIGLQEVTKWTTAGVSPPPGYDFLAILESDLEARGLHYSVGSIAHNANIGPAPLVSETCPVVSGQFTCSVQLEDRDVILVND